jgi:hypothetical protein
VDDIDDDWNDLELSFDLDEEASNTDDDLDVGIKSPRSRRKQVKPDISHVPTGITAEFRLSSTLDALAKELQDQIEAVKAGQEAML